MIAPDSFGGSLTSIEAAEAIAEGWAGARPGDDLTLVPMADGGEGTLEVVATRGGQLRHVEVAHPRGRPIAAAWLLRPDGSAFVESATACGLSLVAPGERNPMRTTTYGVGQLLEDVRRAGVARVVVGLGGSATVDGGAGAALALGVRLTRADGSGAKIGGGELLTVHHVEPTWLDPGWDSIEVALWSDVTSQLKDAATTYGPQKGATPEMVAALQQGLLHWADVVERHLGGSWRHLPGSGAAGGLGFGLAAVLGATIVPGAAAVAEVMGLPDEAARADLIVTGEGRLDATSRQGKVAGHVAALGADAGVAVCAVVGSVAGHVTGFFGVEEAGGGGDPAGEVAAAAARLAPRVARAT
ncbi:MAG: glycerate kinase [Actinomycetota bacterium]|nr:glycerate kinase [Actinomycetota bacterium]